MGMDRILGVHKKSKEVQIVRSPFLNVGFPIFNSRIDFIPRQKRYVAYAGVQAIALGRLRSPTMEK